MFTFAQSVAPLRIQYRMASDIMSLANHLVYDGSMESGSESIANRTVHYRTEDSLLISRNPRWMQEVGRTQSFWFTNSSMFALN